MLYLFCLIVIVIAAILMCFIVLIQNSKGGGLASGFASSNQIMGVRKTTDFLEKATWGLAIVMVVGSVVAAHALVSASSVATEQSIMLDDAAANPTNVPEFATPEEQVPAATGETNPE